MPSSTTFADMDLVCEIWKDFAWFCLQLSRNSRSEPLSSSKLGDRIKVLLRSSSSRPGTVAGTVLICEV